jgi:hypothetical protein
LDLVYFLCTPLAGRLWLQSFGLFDSKLPHNKSNPAQWKMSIPHRSELFWCCSNKEVFLRWGVWFGVITSSTPKKKKHPPNKMDFSFVPKQEKNKNKLN